LNLKYWVANNEKLGIDDYESFKEEQRLKNKKIIYKYWEEKNNKSSLN
jgi:hypothetical protein